MSDLQYLAIRGVANSVEDFTEQQQHSNDILRQTAEAAVDLLLHQGKARGDIVEGYHLELA